MDKIPPAPQHNTLDEPSSPELVDTDILTLYTNGLISRAEADVFQIIAAFNDNIDDEGQPQHCLV